MTARHAVLAATQSAMPAGKALVACSGGPDSAVAAWSVAEVLGPGAVRLIHVDHGQAGSPVMEAAARRVAEFLGLALRVVRVAVTAGDNEEKLRIARLEACELAARDDEWIVTGHQRDDVAETVLGNLVRGAGSAGLSGIPASRGPYVRPLLGVTRRVVLTAADELDLPYANDPANDDLSVRRNVIRHRILPGIERDLGVDPKVGLARSAQHLAADDAALERLAEEVPVRAESPDVALLPAAALFAVPRPVAVRAIRRALRLVRPPYSGSAAEIEAVLDVARGSGRAQLAGAAYAVREGAMVAVVVADPEPAATRRLPIPGRIEFGRLHRVAARVVEPRPRVVPLGRKRVLADLDVVGPMLTVRSIESGDRIGIGAGTKGVRDAMAETGVPVRLRSTWPLVVAGGKIAWVAGVRVAGWARATSSTRRVLELDHERNCW